MNSTSDSSKITLDDFRKSLTATDWTRAHEAAQQDEGREGSWVHAYLHRKEGDQGNAAYWYSRAGKPVCRNSLDAEWLIITGALLR